MPKRKPPAVDRECPSCGARPSTTPIMACFNCRDEICFACFTIQAGRCSDCVEKDNEEFDRKQEELEEREDEE